MKLPILSSIKLDSEKNGKKVGELSGNSHKSNKIWIETDFKLWK